MPLLLRLCLAILGGALLAMLAQRHAPEESVSDGPALAAVQVVAQYRALPRQGISPRIKVTRRLTLQGNGFRRLTGRSPKGARLVDERNLGQPEVRFKFADGRDVRSPLVRFQDEHTVVAWVPEGVHGTAQVLIRNPDGPTASLVVDL